MHMSIAAATDIPALNILINNAYRGEGSKKGWTSEADLLDGIRTSEKDLDALIKTPGNVILVVKDEHDAIIASVCLQKQTGTLYLGMLTVSPLLQAGGIGKRLLAAAEDYAKKENLGSISMTVISLRTELIAWYERHGYIKTGETKPFPTDPSFGMPKQPLEFVLMKKELRG